MKYGVIGCGVMGSAIAGVLVHGAGADQVLVANRSFEKAQAFANQNGCRAGSNEEAAHCDYVVMAVKPQLMGGVLAPLQPIFQQRRENCVLVSMAAGLSMATLREMAGTDLPVIRIMPNLPVSIGNGVVACCSEGVSPERLQSFQKDMASAGVLDELPESLMNAASCIAGCGSAWCFQMIEALADAGVSFGMPRKKALLYAAAMMQGSGALCVATEKHPGILKDEVCSPGGSTIQGVRVLEERGFRGAVFDAAAAAYEKSIEMGKGK